MKRDQTHFARGVAVSTTLSAPRTSEHIVIIIIKRLNGM
jgi:hypothetical protein